MARDRGWSARGGFSNLTSAEFVERFECAYPGSSVSYLGASAFAAGAILGHASEAAGATDVDSVVEALHTTKLREFYSDFDFDENGQLTRESPGAESLRRLVVCGWGGGPRVPVHCTLAIRSRSGIYLYVVPQVEAAES